jgi:hypothetical protein
MLEVLQKALAEVREYVRQLEPACHTTEQAADLVIIFDELVRTASAGRLLVAPRAAQGDAWARSGFRSPAGWLASVTGERLGDAIRLLETADRLEELPETEAAIRNGCVSPAQAIEIADAATVNPDAEQELLEEAQFGSFRRLKDRARRAKARARSEEQLRDREERIRRIRNVRHFTDSDGAFRLNATLTPLDGAALLGELEAEAKVVFDEARQRGEEEPQGAYLADALVRIATRPGADGGSGSGQRAVIHLRADLTALRRTAPTSDADRCEIPGVGPVSLATAEHLIGDAFLKLFITDGIDVQTVVNVGRTITAHLHSALEERDPVCVVPGCGVANGLEIDHWQIPFSEGGPTALWNLARLCRFHHQQKTYGGWVLTGGPGNWGFRRIPNETVGMPVFDPPDDEDWGEPGRWVETADDQTRLDFDGL